MEVSAKRETEGKHRPKNNSWSDYLLQLLMVLLLPVFFITHLTEGHPGLVAWSDYSRSVGNHFVGTIVVFSVCRILFYKKPNTGSMLAWLLVGCFIFWGYSLDVLIRLLNPVMAWSIFPNFLFCVSLIIICTFAFSRLKPNDKQKTFLFLIVLQVLWIGIDAVKIGLRKESDFKEAAIDDLVFEVSKKPSGNVWFLVVDEYASTTSLATNFGYKNDGLDTFLVSKGFRIVPYSKANYNYTLYSIAAILNAQYLETPPDHRLRLPDYATAFRSINKSRVIDIFKESGYQFINNSIFNVQGQGSPVSAPDFPVRDRIFSANNFLYRELMPGAFRLRNSYALAESMAKWFEQTTRKNDVETEKNFYKILAKEKKSPTFIYSHWMWGHAPYYFTEKDSVRLPKAVEELARVDSDISHYIFALRNATTQLEAAIDAIMEKEHRNATIVVMGDHGRRQMVLSKDTSAVYFSNLCAIYYPDKDYSALYDSVSGVNIFRLVMNKTLGTQFPLLKDSTTRLF